MTSTSFLNQASDLSADDYCVFGLATCFLKEDGEFHEVQIIEPIPSAALEAITKGIATSYSIACAKSIGSVINSDGSQILPEEFPPQTQFSDDFVQRTIAAARTYKSRPEAKEHLPLGSSRDDFNYSLEKKRILNSVNIVRPEDNIKQHAHTHRTL